MDILFLDDDPARQKIFQSNCPSATIVATSAECINKLTNAVWDIVFLDHDLGGEIFVDSNREDTGMEVARWLSVNKKEIGQIIVHSHNPAGAANMSSLLKASGYNTLEVPFSWFRSDGIFEQLAKKVNNDIAGHKE